jgi:photosystem II cytochrome c550
MHFREHMKKSFLLSLAALLMAFGFLGGSAWAASLDKETLTVPLNAMGDTTVLSVEQVIQGERLFNDKCAVCHNSGGTKTNPNVGLGADDLAFAVPARNNLEGMVDYLNNPTSYDGEYSIALFHPSIKSAVVFPKMRDVDQDELKAISGYVLIQPKVQPDRWGAGKYAF